VTTFADDHPIVAALADLAAEAPDAPAFTSERNTLSRAEVEARTNRLARGYQDLGVRPDDFVTIGLPNGIGFFESVIATWKCGATPQPISYRLPPREREAIIELADPALVVGVAEAGGRPTVDAWFEADPLLSDEPVPIVVASSYKAPTSGGSIGRPKLIVASQPAVTGALTPFIPLLQMTTNGSHLVTGPLYHNGPLMMAMVALIAGNHITIMPRFDAAETLRLISEQRVDWVYAVPTMLSRIWKLPEETRNAFDLSSLRIVFHMAAPCPEWLKRAWIGWLGPERVYELYGGTEAQAVTFISGTEWLEHPGSVGKVLVGEMRILDADGNELGPHEVGQVWMRRDAGGTPTYRYVGAEATTREDHWEWLGDLGYFDEDGYLYLADRETDMILVGGANVYPAEVEAALEEHPAVASACVIGLPDDELGAVPHAIVQTVTDVNDDELVSHLTEALARYKIPRSFERTDEPLRDDAGKVRRSALRDDRLAARGA